jgi:DNA invertase Pin-like site-specific DNA recombinase
VFREVASGAKTDRTQLRRLTRDLLNTLAATMEKKAGFRSLGDSWADTTRAHGRLMLTVLGGLAEFERDLIRARTGEGRERAKARGVKLGRKPKLTLHQKREAIRRRDGRGTARRHCSHIQREPQHDFAAHGTVRTLNVISS